MKISIYSTAFNVIKKNFNFKQALNNWFVYADEVVISVNTSEDDSYEQIVAYGKEMGFNLIVNKTDFSYDDPFCYGKIENSALQACTGDLLIQQNLDERFRCDKNILTVLGESLLSQKDIMAYWVPVINLYGSYDNYIDIGKKWYIHKRGLFRGPVNFGIKDNGRPDYNKTSTDELIDQNGNLVPASALLMHENFLKEYVEAGYPIVYHLGFVDFNERLSRNKFWKPFWEKATGGDENRHMMSIEEMAAREAKPHGLPLWKEIE